MLLDKSVLQQSCGGDEEFARELFGEYRQRVAELLEAMESALRAGKADDIRKGAHELKGSSMTLGAVSLAQISKDLEEQCKSGNLDGAAGHVAGLREQAEQLFVHLQELGYL